jgi:uncharacterized protein (DUF302 family)
MAQYYFARTINSPMDRARQRVEEALRKNGFGVLTEIDVAATLKKKIDVDFRPYVILGACNPHFAHQALLAESKIGTMLPCNVILQDAGNGRTEVAAVDPIASMQAIKNESLAAVAIQVQGLLRSVIEEL